jgi:molecular chaperone GrpE
MGKDNSRDKTVEDDEKKVVDKNDEEAKGQDGGSDQETQCDTEEAAEDQNQANGPEEEALQTKLLRLQADFINYKSRTEKEKISTYGNAVTDVLKELLPVLDNFERALETDKSENNAFKEGMEMVYTQYIGILTKLGLSEIEALNKPFDHNVHYGVAFEANCDVEEDTVIEVFQKGYKVKDKVIRPAMVKICKN